MIESTRISVGYDETEDRIFLDCSDAGARIRLWLTRRITQRILAAVAELLERSSPTLLKAPADMRQDVIAFEHLSALSAPEAPPATPGEGADGARISDRGAALLHKVDIETQPYAFRLVFHAADGPKAGLTVIRTDLHKTLALFAQAASVAGWEMAGSGEWLKKPGPTWTSDKIAS